MRFEPGPLPRLVLSKRNLLALLHKVDWAPSKRTLIGGGFEVVVEPDEVHYGDREVGPGEMHPVTEAFIEGQQ